MILPCRASPLNLELRLSNSARTFDFVGASTQSKRRSTVIGNMTRFVLRRPIRATQQVGDLPDPVREVVVVRHCC